MVSKIFKADKQRSKHGRKRIRAKYQKWRLAPINESAEDIGILQHFHPRKWSHGRKLQNIFNEKDYQNPELTDDVLIELKQAHNMVNIYSDILTGTMDAFASIISNNVNTIMKRMTSLSIILMVPTLIASFYGMNVDIHIEEVPHAFSIIVFHRSSYRPWLSSFSAE